MDIMATVLDIHEILLLCTWCFPRWWTGASEDATEAGRVQVRFMGISQIDFMTFFTISFWWELI